MRSIGWLFAMVSLCLAAEMAQAQGSGKNARVSVTGKITFNARALTRAQQLKLEMLEQYY